MLTLDQANRLIEIHLGDAPRAAHSVLVGNLMRDLADQRGTDRLVWQLTGLCHDLDFIAVTGDWSRHGLLAAEWLRDDLPAAALDAIRAHDHRAGVRVDTPLADALKLADALAVAHEQLGATLADLLASDDRAGLAARLRDRPWLAAMITALATSLSLSLPTLAPMLRAA